MSQFPHQRQAPAWVEGRTAQTAERERDFIRSVYGWMFGGLLLTAAAAFWVLASPAMQSIVSSAWLFLVIAELGIVFFLSFRIMKMSAGTAAGAFLVFSLLNGLTLSSIFFVYTTASIFQAFVSAGAMFGVMSIYGYVTKRDLTSWGAFFFMGLIGILITMVINFFLQSTALGYAISLIGVFIFLGLTAYDTQKLKAYATAPEMRENLAVIGALALYLDFINLFLFLLRLMGNRR